MTIWVLRPLRLIDLHPQIRQHATTLVYALPRLVSVSVFLFFIFAIYSILGVHLFSEGYYGRCRLTAMPINATYWPMADDSHWCGTGFYSC
jgi:hypothetical protein